MTFLKPLSVRFAPGITVLVCVFLATGTPAQKTTPAETQAESAESHLQKARELFQSKKYGAASSEAKRAIKIKKELAPAYVLLGMIHHREGKTAEALRDVKESLKYDPNSVDAHYLYGILKFEERKFSEAHDEAVFVISHGGRFPNAYTFLAQTHMATNRYFEALNAFEEALRLTPATDDNAARLSEQLQALKGWIETTEMRRDPSYVKPKLLNLPMPSYTEQARSAKIQGSVQAGVLVNEEGRVISVIIFLPLGFGLDEEAVKAARRLRFTPAMKNGQPARFWQRIEIEFNLR